MTTPAPADPTVAPRTRLIRTPNERVFLHVLVNTAAANITTSYLWFALTFWVYLVTLLVPEERHANANGLVGTVQGIAFIITSVFSGLSVGPLGMGWTLLIAIVATVIAGAHLLLLRIPEEQPAASVGRGVDLRGAITAVRLAPGLFALIIFSTFNNLIGGVYIALMDPYGLTLFSVEAWGTVFGFAAAFESAAAPITAFLIAPIAEFWVIPYMETPSGQQTWGWLLGDGEARGIALVFVFAGLAMVVIALLAFVTRSYRLITEQYRTAPETPSQTESETETERTPAP
ncbi:MAG: hypothetical protein VYC96_00400 [Actinomycetota bacterium]|nr:hypothetical protein [Actinomycetota bacterium]